MLKNKAVLLILVLAVVVAAAALYLRGSGQNSPAENGADSGEHQTAKTYESASYRFSFAYPDDYVLTEQETGSAQRRRTSITLIAAEDAAALERGERSEGPPAITFDIFQNNLDQQSVEAWVTGSNDSNYKLPPDDTYTTTNVGGKHTIAYTWDGLYRGESFVFEHNGNIIMASVSYFTPQDQIREDFSSILSSLEFKAPEPLSKATAVALVKAMVPELSNYPSANLPPTEINGERAADSWYLSFEIHGSGLPYILEAVCYKVTDAQEVTKTGEYKHGGGVGAEALSPRSCAPAMKS